MINVDLQTGSLSYPFISIRKSEVTLNRGIIRKEQKLSVDEKIVMDWLHRII